MSGAWLSPLHIAQYAAGSSTSLQLHHGPIVKANDRGARGLILPYGTGRRPEGDRYDASKQTIYSILDKTQYKLKRQSGG